MFSGYWASLVVTVTVVSFTFLISLGFFTWSWIGTLMVKLLALSRYICKVNTTSSAFKGWPSLHFSPSLSLRVSVLPSLLMPPLALVGISLASTGTGWSLLS